MKNVDVDIYISQIVHFFETNPKELKILIGDLDKNKFFNKIKEKAYTNYTNGDDVNLTRKQMIDIVVEIHKEKYLSEKPQQGFLRTKFGEICLN